MFNEKEDKRNEDCLDYVFFSRQDFLRFFWTLDSGAVEFFFFWPSLLGLNRIDSWRKYTVTDRAFSKKAEDPCKTKTGARSRVRVAISKKNKFWD